MKNTIWRNNKRGTYYKILYVALHSETLEKMIVYMSVEDDKVWVRPYNMFFKKFTEVVK